MIQKLLPLRSLTTSFSVLKNFVGASFAEENFETHLWLNKFVKYNGKLMFIKEFFDAGILDARQFIGPNGRLFIKHMIMWQQNTIYFLTIKVLLSMSS